MAYNANDVAKLGHLASLASKVKTELTALDNKYSSAEANVIDTVKVNNVALAVTNKAVNIDLSNYALKSDVTGAMKVKGTVNNFDNLPGTAEIGDMYNVLSDGGEDENGSFIKAGDNVVKTETDWDNLGGTIDFSDYVQKDGSKVLSDNNYTTAEKNKLAAIANNAQVNVIETVQVNGTALTPNSKTVNIDISGKVDKVQGVSGNIVVFGANGAIVDSGIKFAVDADVNAMLETYFPSN